ncbi:hypothetical protein MMC12_007702 [Toensbergia leucococca]|nr:hypothetical protein [Toensbergia leucococca]
MAHSPIILILPDDASTVARICTLTHPRTSIPTQYYFCPRKGLHEFVKVTAPRSVRQSWLLDPHAKLSAIDSDSGRIRLQSPIQRPGYVDNSSQKESKSKSLGLVSRGYVLGSTELLIATPFDLLFLLLPYLYSQDSSASPTISTHLFRSADDILGGLGEVSKHWYLVNGDGRPRAAVEARMETVCDFMEVGHEKMYRLSCGKLLDELLVKAGKMITAGLPSSMEDMFIHKALENPLMGVKRQESSFNPSLAKSTRETALAADRAPPSVAESRFGIPASESAAIEFSSGTQIAVPDRNIPDAVEDNMRYLLRLRTALSYITSAYIPQNLASTLEMLLDSPSTSIDFKPLHEHLASIVCMRTEALASRSLSDFSRKRYMNEDDEISESRADKKRKKDEEERRRNARESKSARDLRKVNTTTMRKLSSFFKKEAVAKTKK